MGNEEIFLLSYWCLNMSRLDIDTLIRKTGV